MNRGEPTHVARLKIISFYDGINIESLLPMQEITGLTEGEQKHIQLKLVPLTMAFLGHNHG
jgi:hypothetical protein